MINASEQPGVRAARPRITRDRVLAGFGVASLLLLGAAFRWAHHWGPVADTIVAAWAVCTLVAGVGSYRDLLRLRQATDLTVLAFVLAGISVVAVVVAAAASALGGGPPGCGGG
jgi:hypothetical protein